MGQIIDNQLLLVMLLFILNCWFHFNKKVRARLFSQCETLFFLCLILSVIKMYVMEKYGQLVVPSSNLQPPNVPLFPGLGVLFAICLANVDLLFAYFLAQSDRKKRSTILIYLLIAVLCLVLYKGFFAASQSDPAQIYGGYENLHEKIDQQFNDQSQQSTKTPKNPADQPDRYPDPVYSHQDSTKNAEELKNNQEQDKSDSSIWTILGFIIELVAGILF